MDNKKANDNSGLAAMAGDWTHNGPQADEETVERVERSQQLMANKVRTFGQEMAMNEDAMIKATCPVTGDDFDPQQVRGFVYPGGRKVYSYAGQEFLEIAAPVISNTKKDDGTYVVTATVKFNKLEPKL